MKPSAQHLNVKILLAEDEIFMRDIVVNALAAGGYHDIEPVAKLSHFQEAIRSSYPDILIVNGEMADGAAIDIIRQIRLFEIGRNPFVPIIVTSWHSEGAFVRKVLDSGADVLVTKPLAAGKLLARIDFLVNMRPPFVATANYLGPDRRISGRDDKIPQFKVPNTLQERIGGRVFDPAELGSRIAKAFASLKRQRRHTQENEIGGLFSAISKATRAHTPYEEISSVIEAITSTATLYSHDISASPDEAADAADALVKALNEIASREQGFSGQDCDRVSGLIGKLGIKIPEGSTAAAKAAGSVGI